MASMKDVAKLAGVSVSTVSRVINNNIPVDDRTKKKVIEAIEQTNYKPNLLARSLRSKQGHMIALVVPEVHYTFVETIHHVQENIMANGYNMILGDTNEDPDLEENFIENLIRMNIKGIIFSRVSDKSRVFRMLERTNIPVVVMDREVEHENIPTIVLNNIKAGELAAEHLLNYGHKKISCISGPQSVKLCRERIKGFSDTLNSEGISIGEDLIYEGDFGFESGIKAAKYFIKIGLPISAISAQNDLMAIGAIHELRNNGIRIPEDISVLGMDDLLLDSVFCPPITTISQPFEEMSRKAVDLIISGLNEKLQKQFRIVVEPKLVLRKSTKMMKHRKYL